MQVVDKHGQPIQVPALSKGFVEPVYWLKYRPPRMIFSFDELMSICAGETQGLAEKYSAAIDEWLDRMAYIEVLVLMPGTTTVSTSCLSHTCGLHQSTQDFTGVQGQLHRQGEICGPHLRKLHL
ncbi:hypothetical protein MRX96_009073 [Rhipicephalus microplus]